jgi:hypothetical protein
MLDVKVGFARRQIPSSGYSHFDGTEEDLITLIQKQPWENSIGIGELMRIRRLEVPAERFWSSIKKLEPGDDVRAVFEPRAPGEEPVLRFSVKGKKVPAVYVEVILYHRSVLEADASTDAEWEVVSINASPTPEPIPMDPTTMARNYLKKVGGTFQRIYTPDEWAKAAWFWTQHANVDPT